ncbi:insulinase family protein [Halosquirtibacter xylanolyticus]|uniref:M16 family metallopeptidase n=1 Tax=Halosquirtibacter xylanolyticus TaxID=3374599 RepID=UPI0037491EEA|nr:insulinase family protein [Prolixibacteraceae bacterium]
MQYNAFTLANGIRLLHIPSQSTVAHFGVVLNTGSRDETDDEIGMAHFIEHVIFKGTKKRKAYHILSRLEDVGGDLNAYTTKEETAIYATFLKDDYTRAIELLSDILKNSTFPKHEIDKEKEVIIEEINSYLDSPSELIYDDFEDLIFKGHPIGRQILGTPEKIMTYDKNDIERFMSNNYNTDEIVLCFVGNIPFERLKRRIQFYFEDIPENRRKHTRSHFTDFKPQQLILDKETYQNHTVIGTVAHEMGNKDRTSMVLLNNIMGGTSMNSRLNLAIRERHGMAYNIESTLTSYSDTGLLSIYYGTDPENAQKAQNLIFKEMKKLRDTKLGSLQLSKAKKQLFGQISVSQENSEEVMLSAAKSFMFFNQLSSLEQIHQKIQSITAEQLIEVANQSLIEDQMSILTYQSKES